RWFFEQEAPWHTLSADDFADGLYPGLPWFLEDLRPQGFLGRAFARQRGPAVGAPQDPRDWQADHVVMALLRYGDDAKGSFVLGQAMLDLVQNRRVMESTSIAAKDRVARYPEAAAAALGGDWPGSSAAGEQPKFTICLRGEDDIFRHAIVKFSGLRDTPLGLRWADLLAAEHYALSVLQEGGLPAAPTQYLEAGGRTFLESERFDRVGEHGRRGLVSLFALDAAYFGKLDNWRSASGRLSAAGWITEEDARRMRVIWSYGNLIGNSDMHFGNLSLFLEPVWPVRLAPVYDMLPMIYRPNPAGDLPVVDFRPSAPAPEDLQEWAEAAALAEIFWQRTADAAEVSAGFREIARSNAGMLARYRVEFAR
ncbi:MAG: type II toxin-antitoxin system HipA family toxin YjjJ, partial [Cupriavidus sp.]